MKNHVMLFFVGVCATACGSTGAAGTTGSSVVHERTGTRFESLTLGGGGGTPTGGGRGCPSEEGVISCNGHCTNVESDVKNCGACGYTCGPQHICDNGVCTPAGKSTAHAPRDPGTWYPIGPYLGGRLDGIVGKPGAANSLVVASPGGGARYSTTTPASWQEPGPSGQLGDFTVVDLQWDRINVGTRLYASTWSDLYLSTDFGSNWLPVTKLGGYPAPLMPVQHPTDPKPFTQLELSSTSRIVLWAKPCDGLFYSYDGSTFTQTWPFSGGSGNLDNCVQSIAADDAKGYVYFTTLAVQDGAGMTPHVYRSTNPWTTTTPSLTWTLVNSGLPVNATVESLTYLGSPNKMGLALTQSSRTYVYTYNGSTWSQLSNQPGTVMTYDPRVIMHPGQNQLFLGMAEAYQTPNYTNTAWSSFTGPMEHVDVRNFYFDNSLGYLWDTTDGTYNGTYANIQRWSWTLGGTPSSETTIDVTGAGGGTPLSAFQAYYFGVTTGPAGLLRGFVGAQDNGGLCIDAGINTWGTAGAPPSNGSVDYWSLVFAPSDANRAYSRTGDQDHIGRSQNAGPGATSCGNVSWDSISVSGAAQFPAMWTHAAMAVHPTNPDALYVVRYFNIGYSTNAGSASPTFSYTANLPGNPLCVYVDSSGTIYAGTLNHGAYYSTNNGATWTAWGLNSGSPAAIFNIAYSSAGGGSWFLATTSGLYRNQAGGGWTLQTGGNGFGGNGYTVNDVAVDPHCPQHVYAAFGFAANLGQHRGGIQLSTDTGSTWTSLTAGLDIHQGPNSYIQVDPLSSEFLFSANFGLGAWEYDSGSTTCP